MIGEISNFLSSVSLYNSRSTGSHIKILENEPLRRHSTFKIGGDARVFAIPSDFASLSFIIDEAAGAGIRYYIIGNGSNILFDDVGFDGVIISTASLNKIIINDNIITADAGAMLSACAVSARDHELSGMECLFGIPGSVGGAVYMNAGAYGGEIKDIIVKTRYLDLSDNTVREVCTDEHKFGYRHSIFKEINAVILQSEMHLKHGKLSEITAAMDDYKTRRIAKQPLDFPSAGSTFKRYPGRYTGQMIEELGMKGFTVGGAQVSEKHAGFVINIGNATSADVLNIIDQIKTSIYNYYGIEIETEVIYVK